MEQWETELREYLDKKIPNGITVEKVHGMTFYMGKKSKIESIVVLHKFIREKKVLIKAK